MYPIKFKKTYHTCLLMAIKVLGFTKPVFDNYKADIYWNKIIKLIYNVHIQVLNINK